MKATTQTTEVPERDPDEITGFSRLVAMIENGNLDKELTDIYRGIIRGLRDIQARQGGKPSGQISLSIKLTLEDGMIRPTRQISSKMPKDLRQGGWFYPTDHNTLTTRNPEQPSLPFRTSEIIAINQD